MEPYGQARSSSSRGQASLSRRTWRDGPVDTRHGVSSPCPYPDQLPPPCPALPGGPRPRAGPSTTAPLGCSPCHAHHPAAWCLPPPVVASRPRLLSLLLLLDFTETHPGRPVESDKRRRQFSCDRLLQAPHNLCFASNQRRAGRRLADHGPTAACELGENLRFPW